MSMRNVGHKLANAANLYRRKAKGTFHVIAVRTKEGYKKTNDTEVRPLEKVNWALEAIKDRKKYGPAPSIGKG